MRAWTSRTRSRSKSIWTSWSSTSQWLTVANQPRERRRWGTNPLPPVDERPRLAGRKALVHLGLRTEEPQDVLVGRLAGADLLERIAGRNRAALPAALGRSPHVNARSERPGDPPPQHEEQRTGEIGDGAVLALVEIERQRLLPRAGGERLHRADCPRPPPPLQSRSDWA